MENNELLDPGNEGRELGNPPKPKLLRNTSNVFMFSWRYEKTLLTLYETADKNILIAAT